MHFEVLCLSDSKYFARRRSMYSCNACTSCERHRPKVVPSTSFGGHAYNGANAPNNTASSSHGLQGQTHVREITAPPVQRVLLVHMLWLCFSRITLYNFIIFTMYNFQEFTIIKRNKFSRFCVQVNPILFCTHNFMNIIIIF